MQATETPSHIGILLSHESKQQSQSNLAELEPLGASRIPDHQAVHKRHSLFQHLVCPQGWIDQAFSLQEVLDNV